MQLLNTVTAYHVCVAFSEAWPYVSFGTDSEHSTRQHHSSSFRAVHSWHSFRHVHNPLLNLVVALQITC
jgi:hypothetical protein